MIGLSTSWVSEKTDDGLDLLRQMERFAVDCVELDYRIPDPVFRRLTKEIRRSGLHVSSLHNFCPIPPGIPRSRASGDLFLLSSLEREGRERAVRWTVRTLEHAHELEAPVVVLHCGKVAMDPETDRLMDLLEGFGEASECFQEVLEGKLAERESRKGPHLDALLWSLDRLLRAAERHGVRLGLENRASYHELPGAGDFSVIFHEFAGAPLGYWHDTGHAHLQRLLGIAGADALVERHKDRLLGLHLHDARGRSDHLPPGTGEIDLNPLGPHLTADRPGILELKPGTDPGAVKDGLTFVREMIRRFDREKASAKPSAD